MKLKFAFLAFLLVSSALAQDYTKQAACIRDTLGKLSQAGKIHAFGIRVTNESSIAVDSFKVGGSYSQLTSKLVDDGKNQVVDPSLNPVDATINKQNRTYSYQDLQILEKDPIQKVIEGVSKAQLINLEKELEQEAKAQSDKQVGDSKTTVKKEEGQLTKDELTESITNLDVSIKKIENKGLTINTNSETASAQIKEILQPATNSNTEISQETKDQIVVINGQRLIKKMTAQTSVLEEKIREENQALQALEDKLKLVTDSKEAETIKTQIKKMEIQKEKLQEEKAKITSIIRVVNQTVETTNQIIKTIKQETEKAALEEIKKFGTKCTSYSVRPSIKFCVKWKTTEDSKVCDQWKDIYRGSKCLKRDATGKCIDTQYFFDETVERYECESHSLDFPKEHCMQWESKNGQAVCIKNETFYQAQTCVEFFVVGTEIKCGRYEGAYPAFRCIKTMMVDGKEVCKEMGAYTPHYYCKEYMMVDGHRYCKKRELFFGTHTVEFECEEKEKVKDEQTGEVHCMKFTAKKLDQFKNFHVQPISEKTIEIVEKAKAQVETEVKKIDKKIITEVAEVEKIEKKIKELEKNMQKMTTTTDVQTIKKIIEAEKKKADTIKHKIEVQKDIQDKIKSAETTVERRKVQIQGEIRDSRGRIVTETEEIKKCDRVIKEAKDKLIHEKDPATIEKIKRIITEESDKKRHCQVTITTIKQDIHEKEKQIKQTKVDIKTIEARIKENETKELIKKHIEELKDKKEKLQIIKDTIKKTTNLEERDALVKNYTIITEQIKTIKHDIKHETKEIKKLTTEEIVTIKKKTETTVEDLKKRIKTLETTITELEKIKKTLITHEEITKIIEIIKKKTEEMTEIKKQIIEIKHDSEIKIIKLIEKETSITEEKYTPGTIPSTTKTTTTTEHPIKPDIIPIPPTKNETKPVDPKHPDPIIIEDKEPPKEQNHTKPKDPKVIIIDPKPTVIEDPPTRDHETCIKNTTINVPVPIEIDLDDPKITVDVKETTTCLDDPSKKVTIEEHKQITTTEEEKKTEEKKTEEKKTEEKKTEEKKTEEKKTTTTEEEKKTTTTEEKKTTTTEEEKKRTDTTTTTDETVPPTKEDETTCIKKSTYTSEIEIPVSEDDDITTKKIDVSVTEKKSCITDGERTPESSGTSSTKTTETVIVKKDTTTGKVEPPKQNESTCIKTTTTETTGKIITEEPKKTVEEKKTTTTTTTTERRHETERRHQTERRHETERRTKEDSDRTPKYPESDVPKRKRKSTCTKKSTYNFRVPVNIDVDDNQKVEVDVTNKKSCGTGRRRVVKVERIEKTEIKQSAKEDKPRISSTKDSIRREDKTESRIPVRERRSETEVRRTEKKERRRRGKTCRKDSTIDIPIYEDVNVKRGSYTVRPGSKKYYKDSGLEVEAFEQKKYDNGKVEKLRRQKDVKIRVLHRKKEAKINQLTAEHIVSRLNRLIEREESEVRKLVKKADSQSLKSSRKTDKIITKEEKQISKFRDLVTKFKDFKCTDANCYKHTHFLNQVERKIKQLERASSIRSARSIRRRKSLERLCNRHFYRLSSTRRHPVHIRYASSYKGRNLQSVSPSTEDVSLVKTFQEHITTFRPADRALLNGCFA